MNTYHITVGTYGTRLHGGTAPTVERSHNKPGEAFVLFDSEREKFIRDRMIQFPVYLTAEQRRFTETKTPEICERGQWTFHLIGCQTDHFHLLLSGEVEPKKIRHWFKFWLTRSLNERFGKKSWFAECGSTKWINDENYFKAVYEYIRRQRITPE